MASNSFGTHFRITTWGESHGEMIGVVIDGCPAGLELSEEDIAAELSRRAPGKSVYTSPRKEPDHPQIVSGLFEGKTTGSPISILIKNRDADSSKYEALQKIYRPGHANYTYLEKYGIFDHRGGGRASARETACRVAAGAIAKKLLIHYGISITATLEQSEEAIAQAMSLGDSIGGAVAFSINGVPSGLGDPVYEKLEAKLASAMLSLPATKGFEIGEGFNVSNMRGSEHNDPFTVDEEIHPASNNAGGTLGGISTGLAIRGRVAFKPASSIRKEQKSVTTDGKETTFTLPEGSRHDPCVAIRAVPVVEAMAALVITDCLLLQRCARL